jgi:hypothetical protein
MGEKEFRTSRSPTQESYDVNFTSRCLIFSIIFIGEIANSLILDPHFKGMIHSTFTNAFNILTSAQEIIVVTSKRDRGPSAINVDLNTSFLDNGIKECMPVTRADNYLIVPKAQIAFSLRNASVWSIPDQVGGSPLNTTILRKNIETLNGFFKVLNERSALGQLSLYVHKNFEGINTRQLSLLTLYALPRIRRLVTSIKNMDYDEIGEAATSLVGLGPGLTPSGDDVLAALMATMRLSANCLGIKEDVIKTMNERILAQIDGRTNLLSQKQMEQAAEGKVSEPIYDFIEALLLPDDDLLDKYSRVLRIGGTSGEDLTLGILIGLDCMLCLRALLSYVFSR